MKKLPENIAAEVPENLRATEESIQRYGRWAMYRRKQQRCGSAERNYIGDRLDAEDVRREPREILMGTDQAMLIQRALQQVPAVWRFVLQALYIPQRLPAPVILAKAKIPPRLSRERHLEGLFMLRNSIRDLQKARDALYSRTSGAGQL